MSLNIQLIRDSFSAIQPHAIEVAQKFHEELFNRHPEAKSLFSEDRISQQQKTLVNSLTHIVEYLEDTAHLKDYLRKMGSRVVAYGVQGEHFAWIAESLLATLVYYFDKQWTHELEASWTDAFGLIEREMKFGMDGSFSKVLGISDQSSQVGRHVELSKIAHHIAGNLIQEALEQNIRSTEFQQQIQAMARHELQQALMKEGTRVLQELRNIKKDI